MNWCFIYDKETRLLPLNKSNIWAFPCRLVLYTENGCGDTWRHITAHKRDKTALIIETQMKLRGVEFHFCPSREMGQGRAAKSSPFGWLKATSRASHPRQLQDSKHRWLFRGDETAGQTFNICRKVSGIVAGGCVKSACELKGPYCDKLAQYHRRVWVAQR